ncbi:Chromatin assembly factor 1 subunit A, partial [Stegodyphus mimosarum]
MALSGKKTPLKNMDIKTAFQMSSARKRKASSPKSSEIDAKNVKLCCKETEIAENDLEVKPEVLLESVENAECKENKHLNVAKDEISSNINKNKSSSGNSKNLQDVKRLENSKNSDSSEDVISEDNAKTESVKSSEVFNSNSISIKDEMANEDDKIENESKTVIDCKHEVLSASNSAEVKKEVSNNVKSKKRKLALKTNNENPQNINNRQESSDDFAICDGNSSTDNADSSEVFNSNNVSIDEEILNHEDKTEDDIEIVKDCECASTHVVEVKEKSSSATKVKKRKRMTPEEAKKKAEEREQKQIEQQMKREELEAKRRERQLEKEKKFKERQMRKQLEEQERKERERLKQEKKEQEEKEKLQKLKEKEEKNKMRQMMLEMKLEEKKKKEEMRLKREEELKKAEEEKRKAKLEKEQKEKEKNERAKAVFAKFFLKGDSHSSPPVSQALGKEGAFRPFEVSGHMILAPVVPQAAQERFDKDRLDHFLQFQDGKELYLQILKSGSYHDVRRRKRERKLKTCEADVILDKSEEAHLTMTAKLLQFSENVRPPYWGTWRKKSKNVRPRHPFGEDSSLDYTVDSDEEWDEGGPGESLSGTEAEDESEDDYEVDNDFFVPHGYLSAEEEKEDDGEVVNDPEKQKALLKIKLQEFEMERKKKTTELKPIILGCFIENKSDGQESSICKFLEPYAAVIISDTPIPTTFSIKHSEAELKQQSNASERSSPTTFSSVSSKKNVPEEAMPHLIRLVHGNTKKRSTLVQEFQDYWSQYCNQNTADQKVEGNLNPSESAVPDPNTDCDMKNRDEISEAQISNSNRISKAQLSRMIRNIATYGKCLNPPMKKFCWQVLD